MDKQKPLFIYDCDGTIQAPARFAWALTKSLGLTNLPFQEYKEQKQANQNAMLPGMADVVRYTATLGNNVLLSGGNPETEGCKELHDLKSYFQNWQFEGKDVPWGRVPGNVFKDNPIIADALHKAFSPSQVVVLGDCIEEFMLAVNMKANTFIKRGDSVGEEKLIGGVPNLYALETGMEIKKKLQELFEPKQKLDSNTLKAFIQKDPRG